MKKYKLIWLDNEAHQHNLGEVETNNPKQVLFNEICKFLGSTSFFYDKSNPDNIMKGIKKGSTIREHYFYTANDHALSIMEVI